MGGLPALAEPSKDKGGQAAHGTPIDRVSRNSRKNQKEEVVSEAPRGTVPFSLRENRDSPLAVLRRLYHLPGNADVRLHLLVAALLTGWLAAELILVAVYYNLRWMARYVLVARRLGGVR